MADREQRGERRSPLKKSVMGRQGVSARDRKSFIRELQRAARARLDKRSPRK